MSEAARQSEPPKKVYPVTWEPEDWQRINEAMQVWGDREHLNLTPADVIRSGTRRFCDEILNHAPAKAS